MKAKEEKLLRKTIKEVLLDKVENNSIVKNKSFDDIKKECYRTIVDLKNKFEINKDDNDKLKSKDIVESIDKVIKTLKNFKKSISNQID